MALITRRGLLRAAGSLAGGGVAFAAYGSVIEAGWELALTQYAINPINWPQGLPLKIAVVADLHACDPWMSEARIAAIVDLANAQQADLIVLLGDYVCTHRFVTAYVAPAAWAAQLGRLRAELGVYSILGNHDWWSAAIPTDPPDDARSTRRALQGAGIPVLENHVVKLSLRGRPFWLIGLGDQIAHRLASGIRGEDDLKSAMRQINDAAPAILLAHEPFIFPRVPDRIALTLSGHTHGGQINFPYFGTPFAPEWGHDEQLIYGHYRRGARDIIVSGGLGTSYAPIRFLRPPEVVVVTLDAPPNA